MCYAGSLCVYPTCDALPLALQSSSCRVAVILAVSTSDVLCLYLASVLAVLSKFSDTLWAIVSNAVDAIQSSFAAGKQ